MGLSITNVILPILWITLSAIAMSEYAEFAKNLAGRDKAIFFLVFLIGGPVFGINQVLVQLLDSILPEGWDDEDGLDKKC